MSKHIEVAIKVLTENATMQGTKSEDALRFTQAALNLHHIDAHNAQLDLDERRVRLEEQRKR